MYFYDNKIFDSYKGLYHCLIDDYKKGICKPCFKPSCGEIQILGIKFVLFYIGKNAFNNNTLSIYVYKGNGVNAEFVQRIYFDDGYSDMNLNSMLKVVFREYLLNHKKELDLSEYL